MLCPDRFPIIVSGRPVQHCDHLVEEKAADRFAFLLLVVVNCLFLFACCSSQ